MFGGGIDIGGPPSRRGGPPGGKGGIMPGGKGGAWPGIRLNFNCWIYVSKTYRKLKMITYPGGGKGGAMPGGAPGGNENGG